jgi:hypothetical protein
VKMLGTSCSLLLNGVYQEVLKSVTSRSDQMKKLGTTGAVTLKYLSHDAYWYFIKTLTFGSTDPKMHPQLAYLAMEIARVLNKTFFSATTIACLLGENFEIQF